jgi:hypothetical protein
MVQPTFPDLIGIVEIENRALSQYVDNFLTGMKGCLACAHDKLPQILIYLREPHQKVIP